MTLWEQLVREFSQSSYHYKWPFYQVWQPQALWKEKNFVFSLSSELTWLRGRRVTWHYGWIYLIISDYPANFGDHSPCIKEDIKLSIFHVMLNDMSNVVQRVMWHCWWYNPILSHSPVKFGDHRACGVGDIKLFSCYLTSRDRVFKGSCDIYGWVSLLLSHHCVTKYMNDPCWPMNCVDL